MTVIGGLIMFVNRTSDKRWVTVFVTKTVSYFAYLQMNHILVIKGTYFYDDEKFA